MRPSSARFSFAAKVAATAALVALFQWLFPTDAIGSAIGAFACVWGLALVLTRPALRRSGPGIVALAVALLLVLALADDPSLLAWVLFWCALSIAALLPRTAGFDDAYRWAARLLLHAASGPLAPVLDLRALLHRRRSSRHGIRSLAAILALPLLGGALFVALFANANPLIARALGQITLPSGWRLLLWAAVTMMVWPAFRPRALATRLVAGLGDPDIRLPGASLPSVVIALGLFNIIFAVENGLDLAFLWSGAPLPDGVTLADYAHRGAYPLIGTALLAGLFVLTMLRPGSASAASPLARRLVVLWVAQNLLLVASSILRTLDYIDSYSLTRLRIAALAWMLLVAVGLVLICWRMLAGRSSRWLINANALVAALMLMVAAFVDVGSVAAAWNVRHAREVGGAGAALDLCYLNGLGPSALLSLIELEQRPLPPAFRDRVRFVRTGIMKGDEVLGVGVVSSQADWHSWTWRNARRLKRANVMLGLTPAEPLPIPRSVWRGCDGRITDPIPRVIASDPARPLTQAAKR